MARGKKAKQRKSSRSVVRVPISRISVPRDPPQFVPLPPVTRRVQLQYEAPTSGTKITPTCGDFFITTYGLDQYKACILQSLRVWSSSTADKTATISVAAGSPWGNTVPSTVFDDKSPVGQSAKVGFQLTGPLLVPWSKAASFAVISSDTYPVLVEFHALFM